MLERLSGDISRRSFLAGVAATGACWPLAALPAEQPDSLPSSQRRLKFADKGGSLGKSPQEIRAKLEKYKAASFDGLEAAAPGLDVPSVNESREQVGLPVHGTVCNGHWHTRLSDPDPKIRMQQRDALAEALRETRLIGGDAVLLVPGKVTGAEESHDDVWKRSITEIRQVLPVAEEQQVKILIENVWNGFCEEPQQFCDYLDEIGSPWVGAYFDIGNVRKFGLPEEWIRLLGPRIGKLDVKDWGKKNGFCRLGEGDVDWPSVRAALNEIRYSGWATREGNDKSLTDTIELMHELLAL